MNFVASQEIRSALPTLAVNLLESKWDPTADLIKSENPSFSKTKKEKCWKEKFGEWYQKNSWASIWLKIGIRAVDTNDLCRGLYIYSKRSEMPPFSLCVEIWNSECSFTQKTNPAWGAVESLITLYTRVGEKKQSGVEAAFEKNCRSSGRAEDSMNACPSRHERRKVSAIPITRHFSLAPWKESSPFSPLDF